MSESPISLRDETGVERFRGTQSPGGGSVPVVASYSGALVAVADGVGEPLGWDNLDSGDDLFDRTDPLFPVFLEAGAYAINAQVLCLDVLTPGGFVIVTLAAASGTSVNPTPFPVGGVGVTVVVVAAAGDIATIQADNEDGAATRSYQLTNTTVVKLA